MNALLALVAAPSALVLGSIVPQGDGWLLRTDDTRLVLAAGAQCPEIRSLRATGDDHDWAGDGMVVPLSCRASVDGKDVVLEWQYRGSEADDAGGKVSLYYECEQLALSLRSVWRARPGRGPVEHWAEIRNRSARTVTIGTPRSLGLTWLSMPGATDLWWIRRGGGNASTQGGTYVEPVRPRLDLELVSSPTDGASPVPWAALQSGGERGLYVGWEFSGVGSVEVHAAESADHLRLSVGSRADFRTDLPPGGVLAVPPAFVGCYRGTIDDGAHSLHRFIVDKLRPPVPEGYPDPTLAYNLYLDAGGNKAREADVLKCARICRDLGFETFVPDAMWFPHVGDWRWDPARFPGGIGPVEELVHSSGMFLGLWCAWTNGGLSEDPGAMSVRRNPDWFNGEYPADWQPGPFYGGNLCLACDEAREWAAAETQRLVRECRLDYLKHDIGPIVTDCMQTSHRHSHGSDVSYWATVGYYDVMDKLRETFPALVLENCSGGGHIKDFGVIQRSHYTVTTDTLSNLPDRQSIWDSTYAFPPLLLQAYTYDNSYPVEGDSPGPFLWRSAMMSAWQIDPTDATQWNEEQRAQVRREVETYKRWIRPMLRDAEVHHVLPRPDGVNWDGLFYWSHSLRRGTLYIFRPASDEAERTVRLAGLDAARRYRVWSEDGSVEHRTASGEELMARGVAVRLPERYSCDLVFVREAEAGGADTLRPPGAFALNEPVAGTDAFHASATLAWSSSHGARSYLVTISEHRDLSSPVFESRVVLPTARCTLGPDRTYYWSVTAVGWGGTTSANPAVQSFGTPGLVPTPGVAFLSDLEWASAAAGGDNPVRRGSNYYGHTPAVGGRELPKGLWTHAFDDATPADIVFDIGRRGAELFRAVVGVDDEAHGGSVQFQVLLDGTVVAESPVLRPGESHRFDVPLGRAAQLTLRVLNGGDGYSCDHAVWGLARLVEAGAADPLRADGASAD